LVLRGTEQKVARTHALLSERLTFTKAYLTWTKESQQIEDRLGTLWREVKAGGEDFDPDAALGKLREIENDMRRLTVSSEEWEVLLREKLQIERALLRAETGRASSP